MKILWSALLHRATITNVPPVLHRFRDIAFDTSKIAVFGTPLEFNPHDGGVPYIISS